MSETTTTEETFDAKVSLELAYQQLVSYEEAYRDYQKADAEDDLEGRLEAANKAASSSINLINSLVPRDVSEKLHARLAEEHPDLAEEIFPAFDLAEVLKQLGLLDADDDADQEG